MLAKLVKQRKRRKFYEMLDEEKRTQAERKLLEIKKDIETTQPDHDMYVHLGMAELLVGQPEDALQSAKEAISMNTVSYLAWYVLGCAYLDLRELTWAQTAYEEAVRLRPQDLPEGLDRGIMTDLFDSLELIEILKGSGFIQ